MWEYAAIVECVDLESAMIPTWYLVKPDENGPLVYREYKDDKWSGNEKRIYKWRNPRIWEYYYESGILGDYHFYVHHYLEENGEEPSAEHIRYEVENEKTKPEIFYESTDILSLINIAAKDGWELSGEINSNSPSFGNDVKTWKTMRRRID
tara:strand:- start:811 stop:1263 length:453 start_codon:yes stop_codon:yes gene_type:complete